MAQKRKFEENEDSIVPPTKYRKVSDLGNPVLKVKKLTEHATIPTKGSALAAGYDLVSAYDLVIPARGKALAKTDIAMAIPEGCYGRIAPRSGLAWKHHIDIGAGVIDADYRGNVGVVMFNLADKEFQVTKGMRIAQLILERYEWKSEIKEVDDLDETVRGSGGYGSTGLLAKKLESQAKISDDKVQVNGGENKDMAQKRKFEETADTIVPPTKYRKVSDSENPVLKVKKLSEHATIPTKGSVLAAGYDLVAAYDLEIPARGKALAKTDIAMAIPEGCYGRIAPRSGLAWKHHIDIGAGVIDADYRGNVGVVMFNLADKEFKVTKGMRIAQLILERYEWRSEIKEVNDLDETVRGSGGYGSTGLLAKKLESQAKISDDKVQVNGGENKEESKEAEQQPIETK
eukprot:CAMPEP_0201591854 /NCGR_PEP_ID=MMETSP0190_2-20130828/189900_1 /ASSEMBLY_ACC=CAM_ASM_000263 /TAXON_ID=37353 /ORGANISM="Rosalina sp." /LENGTH=401 /DNA_ID=CAMNT_0048050345 /DNA_START=81 /DNA_END=1286 /DNA_ORIENTATION=+